MKNLIQKIHYCSGFILGHQQNFISENPDQRLKHTIIYRIRQNFRGGKLSQLCTKHTIHWKTFAVHQAHAIMYCTQQMIQGENFHNWLKNRKNRESFPPRKFYRIQYILPRSYNGIDSRSRVSHLSENNHTTLKVGIECKLPTT